MISVSEEGPGVIHWAQQQTAQMGKNTLVAFLFLVYLCFVWFVLLSPLAAPFCLSFYLDLVKTPTGALIWSFLKPMVLGKILYTPDTAETRAIMGKVWLCWQYVRIRPFERIVIYLARACFFEKQKSVFWLLGVLIKLYFPSCIAAHMSYLYFLINLTSKKISVDAIFLIWFFKPFFLWSFTPLFSASNRDVSQDKCYNLYLFANRPAVKEIWYPRHTQNVRYEAVFLSTCI